MTKIMPFVLLAVVSLIGYFGWYYAPEDAKTGFVGFLKRHGKAIAFILTATFFILAYSVHISPTRII